MFRVALLILLSLSIAKAQDLKSGGPLKTEEAIYDVRHYSITLDVDPALHTIAGSTDITIITSRPASVLLFDLVDLLKVSSVIVNGKPREFTQKNHLLRISTPGLPVGKAIVHVVYGGTPGVSENPPWTGGFTWAKDSLGRDWMAITCEGEGAKVLFPCKDHPSDEPNEGADLVITVPKGLFVAGPGLLINRNVKGSKETFHWKTKYTINNYCILFNVGKYVKVSRQFRTVGGHVTPLEFYVLDYHKPKADRLLDFLERAVRHQEKYFGEYPWHNEKIAICETPHLGMEHQTLNAYGNNFEYTTMGGKDLDWLLLHELGHEWWGNKVTAKDWADVWIHEGICAYADALFTEDQGGRRPYLDHMLAAAIDSQNQRPVVMGVALDADTTYHADIYGKGAFFMHTLRYVMGDDLFFSSLRRLANDPKYTFDHLVTTQDVEQLFSANHGVSLAPLFDLFLRTTSKLDISVRRIKSDEYVIRLTNLDMDVPFEIVTDQGKQSVRLNAEGTNISSKSLPVIDPDTYYLKKVVYE